MRLDRSRLLAAVPMMVGAVLIIVGAVLPMVAWPLVGAGLAMVVGLSSNRRAVAGCAIGLVAAGASLPVADSAVQRMAIAVVMGWMIVGSFGWRRAIKARRSAEAAIDTVLLTAIGAASDPGTPHVVRALADILGATSGRLVTHAGHGPGTTSWDKRTKTALVPLIASGRRTGAVELVGVARPTAWRLTLTDLVASRWAEHVLSRNTAERLLQPEAIDPITGLGNEHAVTLAIASLAPGDSVIGLRLEDLARTRANEGAGRADLLVCQLGLHVRNRLRDSDIVARYGDDRFVLICRNPRGETAAIVDRVLSAWPVWEAGHRILAMSAVHHQGRSPLDTLDAALDPVASPSLDLDDDTHWVPTRSFLDEDTAASFPRAGA